MKHKGFVKRAVSLILSAGIIASGAVSALAASKTNSTYDTNFTGSEELVALLKSDSNLVYNNKYKMTTDLNSLTPGEYAVTGTAVDANGNVVFNSVTDDLSTNHLTDGNLVYNSNVVDIRARKGSSTVSSDYFAPNGTLSFMNDDGTFRNDVYYDLTFRLASESLLNELIFVHSNGNATQYAKYYDVYASDSADTLYNSENLKYSCTNDIKTADSGSVQNIHFDDNTKASYVGIRIKQGVGDDWGFGANYAFVRIFEIGIIGKFIGNSVTYPTPAMSSTERIADKTADGKSITQNLLYNKHPSVVAVKEGKTGVNINSANIGKITDGYYNNTASDSCDIGGLSFVKSYDENTDTYTYYNDYDPDVMTYRENPDTYLTLSYRLDKSYDLSDFWFYSESSYMNNGNHNLRTGVYELYAANASDELYNAENKVLTYVNKNNSYCQKFHFNESYSGKYIGIKVIEGVTKLNTGNWPYSYCRLPEIALFGEVSDIQPGAISTAAEVDFKNVKIKDDFWSGRQDQSLEVGIEACANNLKTSIQNFEYAGLVTADGDLSDYEDYTFSSNFAADSDVYKLMEGMAYAIQNYKDSTDPENIAAVQKIRDYFNDWIPKIVSAQSEDGYIDTLFTIKNYLNLTPENRFRIKDWHELYCAGHLYEAAIAIYNATGDRRLLDASAKNMELVYDAFYMKDTTHYTVGYEVDFHEEVELALIKLAAALYDIDDYGKEYAEKCITLSQHFLDYNMKISNNSVKNPAVNKPVSELTEAWGHCVRAFYLYTAMTDMCIYKGEALYTNLETLWNNVETKTYITGGIGHDDYTEGFSDSYDLSNDKSYCETCSSISNVFWNKSMFLKNGQSKYYDNIEKQIYNNIISGIGLDGWHFYYQNRLINAGGVSRPTWYGTPCCPTNLMRLIQKLGSYIYTTRDNALSVNLYIGNESKITLNGSEIGVKMNSSMPWEGNTDLTLNMNESKNFTLRLRMPKWATGKNTLLINGETYAATPDKDGYVTVTRDWNNGDTVKLTLPMSVNIVDDSELITTNKGMVAVTRGPITYAVESVDNGDAFENACINSNTTFTTNMVYDFGPSNDYGTQKLQMLIANTQTIDESLAGADGTATLNLIPFYSWANRGLTPMKVYINSGLTDPYEGVELAKAATVEASFTHSGDAASNINDGAVNKNKRWTSWSSSYDESVRNPVLTMTFPKYVSLTGTDIYYYDDNGGCRVPDSVEIQYWNGKQWADVSMGSMPTPLTDDFTSYTFDEITTDKLRIKLHHASRALGIVEWKVTGKWIKNPAFVKTAAVTTDGIDITKLSGITESGYQVAPKTFKATVQNTVKVNGKDYELSFWTVDDLYTSVGTTLELQLVESEARTVTAHYAPADTNDYTVTFVNRNNKVIGSVTKSEGNVTAADLTVAGIAADNIFGYTFIGWNCDFADMNKSMTVIPVYEHNESSTLCHIKVNGGSIGSKTELDVKFDSRVTAVAGTVSGKVFSHWKDSAGQVLSSKSTYSFYAASNLELTAVFKNADDETPKLSTVILNMNPIWAVSGNKADIAFTVMVNVPANATVLEQGILIGGNTYTNDPSKLKVNSCDQKGTAVIRNNPQFMITLKSVKSGRVRNVRAYAKYVLDGSTYTVYSNAAVRSTVSDTAVLTEAINF